MLAGQLAVTVSELRQQGLAGVQKQSKSEIAREQQAIERSVANTIDKILASGNQELIDQAISLLPNNKRKNLTRKNLKEKLLGQLAKWSKKAKTSNLEKARNVQSSLDGIARKIAAREYVAKKKAKASLRKKQPAAEVVKPEARKSSELKGPDPAKLSGLALKVYEHALRTERLVAAHKKNPVVMRDHTPNVVAKAVSTEIKVSNHLAPEAAKEPTLDTAKGHKPDIGPAKDKPSLMEIKAAQYLKKARVKAAPLNFEKGELLRLWMGKKAEKSRVIGPQPTDETVNPVQKKKYTPAPTKSETIATMVLKDASSSGFLSGLWNKIVSKKEPWVAYAGKQEKLNLQIDYTGTSYFEPDMFTGKTPTYKLIFDRQNIKCFHKGQDGKLYPLDAKASVRKISNNRVATVRFGSNDYAVSFRHCPESDLIKEFAQKQAELIERANLRAKRQREFNRKLRER